MEVLKFPREVLDTIKEANDIVEVCEELGVKLYKAASGRLVACCPFPSHKDDTPSFSVYTDKQNFHCYGCHAAGDVIDLVKGVEDLSFPEAINRLATRGG